MVFKIIKQLVIKGIVVIGLKMPQYWWFFVERIGPPNGGDGVTPLGRSTAIKENDHRLNRNQLADLTLKSSSEFSGSGFGTRWIAEPADS
jgi:hypothetical protein